MEKKDPNEQGGGSDLEKQKKDLDEHGGQIPMVEKDPNGGK